MEGLVEIWTCKSVEFIEVNMESCYRKIINDVKHIQHHVGLFLKIHLLWNIYDVIIYVLL